MKKLAQAIYQCIKNTMAKDYTAQEVRRMERTAALAELFEILQRWAVEESCQVDNKVLCRIAEDERRYPELSHLPCSLVRHRSLLKPLEENLSTAEKSPSAELR